MPLMLHAAPANSARVFEDAIIDLRSSGLLALPYSARPTLSSPMRVFALDAPSIAQGRGLAEARPIGWWSEVHSDGAVVGALELTDVPSPGRGRSSLRFGACFTGALQRGVADAIRRSAREAGRRRVLVALIRAPAVQLTAIWLKQGIGDVLVPVAPANAALDDRVPIAADVALRALAPAAQRALSARN